MAAVCGASLAVCVCVLLLPAVPGLQSEHRECAYTEGAEPRGPPANQLQGAAANQLQGSERENGTVRCSPGARCYGLWEKKADGEIQLVKQGCWTHQQECHGDRCLVTAAPSLTLNGSYRFCCCSTDLCNANFTEAPPTGDTPARRPISSQDGGTDQQPLRREEAVLVALVTVAIAAVVIVALFLGYRMMRGKQKLSLSAVDVMEAAHTDSTIDINNLKLQQLVGGGRHGSVFLGSVCGSSVAVKCVWERQAFLAERSVLLLPLQHPNILRLLSSAERTAADGRPEYLLILEYYPQGCLSQYLSLHTVDWLTCCRMMHGITRGLAFLHTELYRGDQYKPAVAHRDVSSRNVLVRADLSCVLADFGLSMKLTGGRACRHGDDDTMAISEVGTVRYMAPEVLGGAVNLRDCEAALKQVDVYALGLLYWESFRRCPHLFPGEAVPEHQLAFQEELGNHPTFEQMQILVSREKHRPRFPEAWKDNSVVLRCLKDTMEDCWDQDAEARLTAHCAEQRLLELTQLHTHTHRNLSPAVVGSSPSLIEDLQVKNLHGDGPAASVVTATDAAERNRKNEWQQAQVRPSERSTPPTINTSEHTGGAVQSVCLLTEGDLEATKLHPREVDKNLRESSDENLMEHSQKQFGSAGKQTTNLLYHQILQTAEVNHCADAGPAPSLQPLPKQQNLPHRPSSLHLLPKTTAPPHLRLGKPRVNHRQVETGVAKMNTVTVGPAVEPHLVTTVTNNTGTRGGHPVTVVANGYGAAARKGLTGGGRTNPAGPQLEEEDGAEGGPAGGGNSHTHLLNPSPDEHQPLLRTEQPPAQADTPNQNLLHLHRQQPSGRGSNYNNNNNTTTTHLQGLEEAPGPELHQTRPRPGPGPGPGPEPEPAPDPVQGPGPCVHRVCPLEPGQTTPWTGRPKAHMGLSTTADPDPGSSEEEAPGSTDGQTHVPPAEPPPSDVETPTFAPETPKPPSSDVETPTFVPETPKPPSSDVETPTFVPETPKPPSSDVETPTFAPETQKSPPSDPPVLVPGLLRPQMGPTRAKRPERPCSLDLSSSCISSDDVPVMDNSSLSISGEKIKRRVKTPYTLKKWRPASWVVSTDTALDPDFEFTGGGGSSSSSYPHRAAKINQSKSSMAVFLVGGGTTATTASEPDGMTCF